jgi:hypothetical protein
MNLRSVVLVIAAAILAAGLVGCGGGGGGGGQTDLPGVSLTISADTTGDGTRSVTSRGPIINAPLDEGAVAIAYEYRTGDEVARGTLDAGGQCTLDVTPGLTIVVVITGTKGGKDYRLSTIIANVPVADEEVFADPATTIAAEAVASKHPKGSDTVLDDATFDAVLTQATAYVVANADGDYSLTGGLIGGTAFGGVGSIVVATVQAVVDAVPAVIDSNLILAKNAVQQIKEAGIPLMAMTEQEIPDAEGIFTDEVLGKYEALADRLSDQSLLGGVAMRGVNIGGEYFDLMEIPLGHTYTLDGESGTLTETGDGQADRYTITYIYTNGETATCTLVAVKNGSQWTVTETRDTDALLEYKGSFPEIVNEDPGHDPSLTGSFSFKDTDFPTPLTFNGTASAVGSDKDAYTKMVFDGTLAAPDFSARGRFEVNFRSTMPSNAKPDDVIYDFATSASMTDASIAATDSAGNTITLTGDMSATATTITKDGYAQQVPTHFEMSGTYGNSQSGLGFEGSITANWTNPGVVTELTAKGSVNLHGELTRTGYPPYYEDLTVTLDNSAITSDIDLRVGGNRLHGSASGTMVHDNPPYGTLTLTNQSGVQFNLAIDTSEVFSGSMKAGDPLTEVTKSITKVGDRMRITFTDDTYEEF